MIGTRRGALLASVLVACSGASGPGPGPAVVPTPDPVAGRDAEPAPEPPPASQEEKLAAIQKAMNDLDGAARQCWAAAATERFDIAGDLVAKIDIAGADQAIAMLVKDTAAAPRLSSCLIAVLTNYRWAPPLFGETIQLPFRFAAPAGQSVIDRQLVPWNGQGKLSVAVLLDEANSGSARASMFELAIAAGGATGLRWADRAELWYFHGPARVRSVAGGTHEVAAGDMMYAPQGSAREVAAPAAADTRAVIVMIPGGREGTARAGALPTREATSWRAAPASPIILRAAAATTHGPARIFAEAATIKDKGLSASLLALPAGANVPEHVHAGETELLYVLAGSGTLTIAGSELAVAESSVIQIPPNTRHAFTAATAVRAVQVYTPAGPEQRFKARPSVTK
jgi:putative monooxygenase